MTNLGTVLQVSGPLVLEDFHMFMPSGWESVSAGSSYATIQILGAPAEDKPPCSSCQPITCAAMRGTVP